jgi:arylsulfatase A-like enzyme
MSDETAVNRSILPVAGSHQEPTAVHVSAQSPAFADPQVSAPEGAPNVVVVLLDDMGFGASSAFGGPCRMPTAERLAGNGLRYTRFHTTAICSATRAALLTGRNHHSVGFGHVVDQAASAPGYNGRRPASAATIARTLACNGYATGAFGKMHQTPMHEVAPVGPKDRWPTGSEGFQRFYGFLGGQANHWHPSLYDGTTPVEQPRTPAEGYHLSEDLVDKAVAWIRDVRSVSPQQPFFCYVPFGATHSPFHVAPEWVERYRGCFDDGWDAQRERTLARQRELGVVPADAELAPWASTLPRWDELDAEEQRASAILMELYAGFAEHTDAQVGRLVDALDGLGVLADTLILYILGDNGASAEGGLLGTHNEYAGFNGIRATAADILARADDLGSPSSYPHYSAAWALAMDTPYPWMKQVASHYGGTRNGLVVHWPNGIEARNELRHQWHHVIDVAPTLLEAARLPEPAVVDAAPQTPMHGSSMVYSFDDATAAERRTTQYFEIGGSRGIYHDGWVACTPHRTAPWDFETPVPALADDVWELYDTTTDWTEARDLATQHPARLAELKELFLVAASRYQVLPIEDRPLAVRWSATAAERGGVRSSMTFHGETRRLPQDLVPRVVNASHAVSARIVIPEAGADGVICAQGGRFSGWALYCKDGILTYCHNVGLPPHAYVRAVEPLLPGAHEVLFDFEYDGGGVGKGGTGTLVVDGEPVAQARIERTVAFLFTYGEGFDVGVDLYTAVSDEYAQGANTFTGEIEWVRIDVPEEREPPAEERLAVELAVQ